MNAPKPLLIALLTLIVALGTVLLLISLRHEEKVSLRTEEQTVEQERQKDFTAIKVINIIDTLRAVDAFGHKLKVNEWYIQSNITRSVFPINTKSTNCTKLDWLMSNGKKELSRIKITNGDPLGAYIDGEILLLGNKKLVLNDLEQYQVVSIK